MCHVVGRPDRSVVEHWSVELEVEINQSACCSDTSRGAGVVVVVPAATCWRRLPPERPRAAADDLGLAPLPEHLPLRLRGVHVALGERRRVPVGVVAHRVEHLAPAPPPHVRPLPRRHDGAVGRHELELSAGAGVPVVVVSGSQLQPQHRHVVAAAVADGGATADHQSRELGREGTPAVVHLVPAVVGGPGGSVPDGGVHGHGLGRVVPRHGGRAGYLADGHAVHVEDDGAGGPEDGEAVRRRRRVEGHQVPLLAPAVRAAVAVHVGLETPLVAPPVA